MQRPVRNVVATLLLLALPARAGADPAAIARGVQYLRAQSAESDIGQSALIALAMVKAEVGTGDPALLNCIGKIKRRFNGSIYTPQKQGGADVYEAAVVCLALVNHDPVANKGEIAAAAQYLMGQQKANGCWDYTGRDKGDTSISQYATLGLWEAENAGVEIPPRVWDKVASWFLSVQGAGGSWNYHRDETQYPETVSMTAAGVGSLLICQRQLALHRSRSYESDSPLLVPIVANGDSSMAPYKPSTPVARVAAGIRRGIGWISGNFSTEEKGSIGQSLYYGLYGIERLGALADRETLGGVDWYNQGLRAIVARQQGDGRWTAQHGDVPNTAWAVLFLTKSTAKTVRKIEIKRLGAGTLMGGRYLPKDLSNLSIAQGRVVVRPMNGAIDEMLDVLGDPRAQNADAALAGLVERYHREGPKAVRPHKARFRKLLADRDPGVRRVAAWGLGRTTDLDVVPALLGAFDDPDDVVVAEAKTALQVVSRKLDDWGPPPGATPEQRREAAARWRAWFDSARPPDAQGPDADLVNLPAP